MKFTLAFVSLLPVFGAAISVERGTAEKLPTVEGDVSDHTHDVSESQPAARSGYNAQSAALCDPGYPYICDGFCCPYNRCCTRECCGTRATFCGADGLCYI